MCSYLDPEGVASVLARILLQADEPPLQPNGTVQLVLDLQVGRDQEHFRGAALPALLMCPCHLSASLCSLFTEELNPSFPCEIKKYIKLPGPRCVRLPQVTVTSGNDG